MNSDEISRLLIEIRDIQRDHFDEYRRVTAEQLNLTRQAVERQEQHARLYRRAVLCCAVLLAGVVGYLLWLSGMIE